MEVWVWMGMGMGEVALQIDVGSVAIDLRQGGLGGVGAERARAKRRGSRREARRSREYGAQWGGWHRRCVYRRYLWNREQRRAQRHCSAMYRPESTAVAPV